MAHSLSAQKRIRQNVKARARNRWRKTRIKDAVKAFIATVHAGDKDKASTQLKGFYKLVDQMAATKSIHKNAASRYKARLTIRLNKIGKPAPTKAA